MEYDNTALRTADLFAGLNAEEIEGIVAAGKRKIYQRGDIILEKGERSSDLYIVVRGQVEVNSEWGEGPTLIILGAGQGFGEMSLLDAGPRSATIVSASEQAELLVLSRETLLKFCEEHCAVGYKLMYNLARDLAFKLRIRNMTCQ
ncbi:MAG: cyclic nucleotide-binding domain-containing protein [Anaerolineae bacterium]|nr:cyclic nucleotide-binding domain-containing protein [Anaerolineae bacterium]